jgi:hypothetical protein
MDDEMACCEFRGRVRGRPGVGSEQNPTSAIEDDDILLQLRPARRQDLAPDGVGPSPAEVRPENTDDLARGLADRGGHVHEPKRGSIAVGRELGFQQGRRVHVLDRRLPKSVAEPGALAHARPLENTTCRGTHPAVAIGKPDPGVIRQRSLHRLEDFAQAAGLLHPVGLHRLERCDVADLPQAFGHVLIEPIGHRPGNLQKGVLRHIGGLPARQQRGPDRGHADDRETDQAGEQTDLAAQWNAICGPLKHLEPSPTGEEYAGQWMTAGEAFS